MNTVMEGDWGGCVKKGKVKKTTWFKKVLLFFLAGDSGGAGAKSNKILEDYSGMMFGEGEKVIEGI